MPTKAWMVLPLALGFVTPGCASRALEPDTWSPAPRTQAELYILNHRPGDVRVILVKGSHKWRIDLVTGATEDSVKIPAAVVSGDEIRVLLQPVGSPEEYLTDEVPFSVKNDYLLTIQDRLPQSTLDPLASAPVAKPAPKGAPVAASTATVEDDARRSNVYGPARLPFDHA